MLPRRSNISRFLSRHSAFCTATNLAAAPIRGLIVVGLGDDAAPWQCDNGDRGGKRRGGRDGGGHGGGLGGGRLGRGGGDIGDEGGGTGDERRIGLQVIDHLVERNASPAVGWRRVGAVGWRRVGYSRGVGYSRLLARRQMVRAS